MAIAQKLTGAADIPLTMEDTVDDALIQSIEEYMKTGRSDFGVRTAPADARTIAALESLR